MDVLKDIVCYLEPFTMKMGIYKALMQFPFSHMAARNSGEKGQWSWGAALECVQACIWVDGTADFHLGMVGVGYEVD